MLHPIVKPVLRTSLIGYVCVVVSLPMKRHRDIGAPAREPYKTGYYYRENSIDTTVNDIVKTTCHFSLCRKAFPSIAPVERQSDRYKVYIYVYIYIYMYIYTVHSVESTSRET